MIRMFPIAALALAACAPVADEPVTPVMPSTGRCDATSVQDFVGKPADQVQAEARARSGARVTRVYTQGSPVTMDLREDRLNIVVDAQKLVVEMRCG